MKTNATSSKSVDTLVEDIYSFVSNPTGVDDKHLDKFLLNLKELIKKRFETPAPEEKDQNQSLRMSKIGLPDKRLWFEMNVPLQRDKQYKPEDLIKFLYGDILELFLIFLVKQAGHTCDGLQDELSVNGVVGHRDLLIDGVTVDIKTASKFSFEKFKKAKLFEEDPFGYVAQLSAYKQAGKTERSGWLAINKESGELCWLELHGIDEVNAEQRVNHIREVIAEKEPPKEPCYKPVPFGKSGNMELNRNCSYCPYKDLCWKDANDGRGIRRFAYANGVKELVNVAEEPQVAEVI